MTSEFVKIIHGLGRLLSGSSYPRYMYDGIGADAGAIYHNWRNVQMVAGYDDGYYQWSLADWQLFPHAVQVHIVVTAAANSGDVLDCETGDATPTQAGQWVFARKEAGYYRPTVYCNLDTAPYVRAATGNLVLGVDYDLWIADWTGSPHQVVFSDGRKAAATQYMSEQSDDRNVVYDSQWPHRSKPVTAGPYRHVVGPGNVSSLDAVARSRGETAQKIADISTQYLTPLHAAVMNTYMALDNACANAGINRPAMPTGMIYWTINP